MIFIHGQNGLRTALITGLASFALLLTACDSAELTGLGTSPDNGNTPVESPPTDTPTETNALDIISTAEAAGNFTTLLAAIETANLRDQLADENNTFTLFAPTDNAFKALGEDSINELLADTETLTDVLLYHVIEGALNAEAVTTIAGSSITTLNGQQAAITIEGTTLRVNTSIIEMADLEASNGLIHVIDAVLSPPAIDPTPADDLFQVINNDPQFTTLSAALVASGLDTLLAEDNPFTIFAPNNAAFNALGDDAVNDLLADPDALREVLLFHLIENRAIDSVAATAVTGSALPTASGDELTTSLNGDVLMINEAAIVRADISAANGIAHEIDMVLIAPQSTAPSDTPASVIDVLEANEDFSELLTLIASAGLTETLSDANASFTIFAPDNAAFGAAESQLATGFTTDTAALMNLLLGHVHDASLTESDLSEFIGSTLNTLDGTRRSIGTVRRVVTTIDNAAIILPDQIAQNGVVHGINAVLLP